MMWILDTDHLSLLLYRHPNIVLRLAAVDPKAVAITIVTAEEQLRGRLNVVRRASQSSQTESFVRAYAGLKTALLDLQGLNILDFDSTAQTCYTDLLRQKIRIGRQDLRIAAIALATHATVVTRNHCDFSQVPGLLLEDWSG
jgi:tRNA(fMet)-specific endonuclease VapC